MTDSPEFKRWFGKSQMADRYGNPIRYYHGTTSPVEFSSFKVGKGGPSRPSVMSLGAGHYFTPFPETADAYAPSWGKQAGRVIPAYLKLENPWQGTEAQFKATLAQGGLEFSFDPTLEQARKVTAFLQSRGYDGVIVDGGDHGQEVVVFSGSQVKSAIANDGSYGAGDDMLHQRQSVQPDTPAFDAWFGDSVVRDERGKALRVFHGTKAGEFDTFSQDAASGRGKYGPGFYFSEDAAIASYYAGQAEGSAVMPVYLRLQRPFDANAKFTPEQVVGLFGRDIVAQVVSRLASRKGPITGEQAYRAVSDVLGAKRANLLLRKAGFDGIMYSHKLDRRETARRGAISTAQAYVAFEPTQVKSATANRGTYRLDDGSTLHQVQKISPEAREGNFERWWRKSQVVDEDGKPKRMYHGGINVGTFDRFDYAYLDPNALYGPGFYFTDAPAVAAGEVDADGYLVNRGYAQNKGVPTVEMRAQAASEMRAVMNAAAKDVGVLDADFTRELEHQLDRYVKAGYKDELDALMEEFGMSVDDFAPSGSTMEAYLSIEKPFDLREATTSRQAITLVRELVDGLLEQYGEGINASAAERFVRAFQQQTIFKHRLEGETLYKLMAQAMGSSGFDVVLNQMGEFENWSAKSALNTLLWANGYDGIRHTGGGNVGWKSHDVWIAFDPTAIKSTVANKGTYSLTDASVLEQRQVPKPFDPELAGPVTSREFAEWFGTSKVKRGNVPTRVFHGGAKVGLFNRFDFDSADRGALYGPGFYFTEDPEVAGGRIGADGRVAQQGYAMTTAPENMTPAERLAVAEQMKARYRKENPRKGFFDKGINEQVDEWARTGDSSWLAGTEAIEYTDLLAQGSVLPAYLNLRNPFDADRQFARADAVALIEKAAATLTDPKSAIGRLLQEKWHTDRAFPHDKVFQAVSAEDARRFKTLALVELAGRPKEELTGSFLYQTIAFKLDGALSPYGIRAGRHKLLASLVLSELGYDGITHIGGRNVGWKDHRVWIAWKPNQVKSALANSGKYGIDEDSFLEQRQRRPNPSQEAMDFTKIDRGVDSVKFKEWFGESKVVDEKGKPKKFYHGGGAVGTFEAFDMARQDPDALYGPGFYFTDDPKIAGGDIRDDGSIADGGYAGKGRVPLSVEERNVFAEFAREQMHKAGLSEEVMEEADILISAFVELGDIELLDELRMYYNIEIPPEKLPRGSTMQVYLKAENPLDVEVPRTVGYWDRYVRTLEDYWADQFGDEAADRWRARLLRELRAREKKVGAGKITGDHFLFDMATANVALLVDEGHGSGQGMKVLQNEMLRYIGHDSIRHTGGLRVGDKRHNVVIVFDNTQVKSAIANRGTYDINEESMLKQEQPAPGSLDASLSSMMDNVDAETVARHQDKATEQGKAGSEGVHFLDLHDAVRREGLKAVGAIEGGFKESLKTWKPAERAYTRGDRAVLEGDLTRVMREQQETMRAAQTNAGVRANFALLDYQDKRGVDQVMQLMAPFSYWGTRQGMNYATRMMANPAMLATYYRYRQMVEEENRNQRVRGRFGGGMRLPWGKALTGSDVYVDPMSILFPFAPSMSSNIVSDAKASRTGLQQLYDTASSLVGRPSPIFDIPLRISGALTSKSPGQEGYGEEQTAYGKASIGQMIPLTGAVQAVTAAAGVGGPTGVDIEAPVRKAVGLSEGEPWDAYRVNRSVSDLAAQANMQMGPQFDRAPYLAAQEWVGKHEQDLPSVLQLATADRVAKELQIPQPLAEQALAIVRQAATQATQQRGFQQASSYFTGVRSMQLPEGEQIRWGMRDAEKGAGYNPIVGTGSRAEVREVQKQFGALDVQRGQYAGLPGEDRDTSYLLNNAMRDEVNKQFDLLKQAMLQQRPFDRKSARAIEDARWRALQRVKRGNEAESGTWREDLSQAMAQITGVSLADSQKLSAAYRPVSVAGADPAEAMQIRRDEIMRQLVQTQPQAEQFTGEDGAIDFDAYRQSMNAWRSKLSLVSRGIPAVASVVAVADQEGRGVAIRRWLDKLSGDDVDAWRRRNDDQFEAIQRAYFERVYNPAMAEFGRLRDAGDGDAWDKTVGAIGPMAGESLLGQVREMYPRRFSEEQLAQVAGLQFPAAPDVMRANMSESAARRDEARSTFWTFMREATPPGSDSYALRQMPLVAAALDQSSRATMTEEQYRLAMSMAAGWVSENVGPLTPELMAEWAQARQLRTALDVELIGRYGNDGLAQLRAYEMAATAQEKTVLRRRFPVISQMLRTRTVFARQNPILSKYYRSLVR